jgi:hypothetical protein
MIHLLLKDFRAAEVREMVTLNHFHFLLADLLKVAIYSPPPLNY